jgi:Rrf2 family nitric oxide-sensitive transcriptional repressor
MLTKTSEVGIQTLIYLSVLNTEDPVSPKRIAAELDQSPSYLSKITGQLVKANLLTAHRGVHGGVTLSRSPEDVTLLDIVQALQGLITGNYCASTTHHPDPVCAFHAAMREVHRVTVETLTKWTVADLLANPVSREPVPQGARCKMEALRAVIAQANTPSD